MYTQLNGNGREVNCKRYQCEIVKCILAETKPENVKSFHHRILDLFGNMCTNCDYLQYYRFRACGFMRRFKERRNLRERHILSRAYENQEWKIDYENGEE